MNSFEAFQINGTGGLIDQIKDKLDNFDLVLDYYDTTLANIGMNNHHELGFSLVVDCYRIKDMIDVMTKKLEQIRYGTIPCPPCFTGTTGPAGWETCGTGVSWT